MAFKIPFLHTSDLTGTPSRNRSKKYFSAWFPQTRRFDETHLPEIDHVPVQPFRFICTLDKIAAISRLQANSEHTHQHSSASKRQDSCDLETASKP